MSRFLSVIYNRLLRTHHHLLTWLSENAFGLTSSRFCDFELFLSTQSLVYQMIVKDTGDTTDRLIKNEFNFCPEVP